MPFKKPCLKCNRITTGNSYCDNCKPHKPDSPQRKAKKAALYGGDYRRRANAIKATATHCHICNKLFEYGDRVEADHIYPELGHESPLAPAHRHCNQKRGNKPI